MTISSFLPSAKVSLMADHSPPAAVFAKLRRIHSVSLSETLIITFTSIGLCTDALRIVISGKKMEIHNKKCIFLYSSFKRTLPVFNNICIILKYPLDFDCTRRKILFHNNSLLKYMTLEPSYSTFLTSKIHKGGQNYCKLKYEFLLTPI